MSRLSPKGERKENVSLISRVASFNLLYLRRILRRRFPKDLFPAEISKIITLTSNR